MSIDTREELIGALAEASEIEHGLLIQYLFAAVSFKKTLDEGLTPPQQAASREWAGTIFRVAVDEMGHFGTVCNLQSAIGAPPHFMRPNFPKDTGYYPFPFDLVPFSDEALYRMQVFELPRGEALPPSPVIDGAPQFFSLAVGPVAPEPLVYRYVGDLYQQIADAFQTIPEDQLFIGPKSAQATDNWSVSLDIRVVNDRGQALAAIADIIEDGEGTPSNRSSSHYGRFSRIREKYSNMGRFSAARSVVRNPCTRQHRDADGPAMIIVNQDTLRISELFNLYYSVVLHLLLQYFSYGGETENQRTAVKDALSRLMSVAIRPLAEILTELPYDSPDDPRRAGPGFELYTPVSLAPFPEARWTLLLERFDRAILAGNETSDLHPRLKAISETVTFIRRTLANVAKEGS
jgi:hypothetical protein